MMKRIDPHVHCRDWGESAKSTIREVILLAKSQGVAAVFDMPNTKPAITTANLVEERLLTAAKEGCSKGYYLYIGATSNPDQLKEAARVAECNQKVVGIKMYAGTSIGDLSIAEEDEQCRVFQTLADINYKGVIAVHCEKENLAKPDRWIPEKPFTWNLARPPEMEVVAARDIIKFAEEAGFMGHLHICHVSTPTTVRLVNNAKRHMQISCGVTPHHLVLSTEDMRTTEGIEYKVNPPIRDHETMATMMELLKNSKIDWIETDHAPHREEEKTYTQARRIESYMSGIRSLEGYAAFLQSLMLKGFTDGQLERLTYLNIKRVFTKVRE